MRRLCFVIAALLGLHGSRFAVAEAPEPFDDVYSRLTRVREIRGVAISPDGSRVARVEPASDDRTPRATRILVQENRPGAAAVRITASLDGASVREGNVVFSPDGKTLAFVSHAGGAALWTAPAAGDRAATRMTRIKGSFADPRWSRDGRSLAVLVVENAAREPGPTNPSSRDSGVVDARIDEQRLAIVDVETKVLRFVSPPDLYVYEYDWSPDGRTFAAVAAKGSGDDNWWRAELLALDAASGAARLLWKPPLQIADPVFAPDGSSVAVIHGLMSDHGATGGDVFVVPAFRGSRAEPHAGPPRLRGRSRLARSLPHRRHGARGRRDGRRRARPCRGDDAHAAFRVRVALDRTGTRDRSRARRPDVGRRARIVRRAPRGLGGSGRVVDAPHGRKRRRPARMGAGRQRARPR